MGGRLEATGASVGYIAVTAAAAVADGMAHASTRGLVAALIEAGPAVVLAAVVLRVGAGPRRRGAGLFVVAMLLMAGGVVATSGTHGDDIALTVGALLAVSVLLAFAYLRVLAEQASPRRRWAVTIVLLLCLLAVLATGGAASLATEPRRYCGVDSCAFNGLGIAFAVSIGCECALLLALIPAVVVDLRGAAGVTLFAVGVNLLLVVAPQWSRYQGVAGVALGYTGLALAALPWLAPRMRGARTRAGLVTDGAV